MATVKVPQSQAQADAIIAADKKEREQRAARERSEVSPIQYTLFASGLENGGRFGELETKNTSDDVALIFDVIDTHSYSKSYRKTSYAVESKAMASDHVVTEDGKFSFSAKITDSPYRIIQRNFLDKDTDPENPKAAKRPEKALEIVQTIADQHQLVTLVTEDNILTGYVITSFSAERSAAEGGALIFDIELEEFRFKNVSKTVLARTDPKKATNKNAGAKQTAEGGEVDEDLKGKRSPYIWRGRGWWEDIEHRKTGRTFPDAVNAESRTITPGEKFDPKSILTGGSR